MSVFARLSLCFILFGAVGADAIAAVSSKKALSDAQKLSRKGDHDGAAKLLRKACDADPKNAQLLSELGWQWFLAHDLTRALEATNEAVNVATTPTVKAASLYNLGRIKEALGKRDEAVSAYAESLSVRANPTVLRRLAGLDPKKAAELDPDRPVLLEGPFSSISAWCDQLRDGQCYAPKQAMDLVKGPHAPSSVRPPYQAVEVFIVGKNDDLTLGDCALAVQLASGWYVRRVVEDCREGAMFRRPETTELAIATLPGAPGPVIRWGLRIDVSHRNNEMEWVDEEPEWHTITCGIGPSGKPSCGEPYSRGLISFP
jgi:hypothetical protein